MANGQLQCLGPGLNRAGSIFFATSSGPRRLGIDTHDLVSRIMQRIKCVDGKLRCAHKHNSHKAPLDLALFAGAPQQHVALDAAQIVKIHPTCKMVDLMLNRPRL